MERRYKQPRLKLVQILLAGAALTLVLSLGLIVLIRLSTTMFVAALPPLPWALLTAFAEAAKGLFSLPYLIWLAFFYASSCMFVYTFLQPRSLKPQKPKKAKEKPKKTDEKSEAGKEEK